MTKPTWRTTLDSLLTAVMAGLIVWLGWTMYRGGTDRPPPVAAIDLPAEPVSLEGAHLRGDPAARVAVLMYVDYHCPACRAFERDTLPVLQRDYIDTGRVVLGIRSFPLAHRGEEATDEAALAECAGKQGRFWEAHDALFGNARASGLENLGAVGAATGLDSDLLSACVAGERANVQQAVEDALRLGVRGTPAFLIGPLDSEGRVRVSVARHGISSGSQWFVDLLQPVVEAAGW